MAFVITPTTNQLSEGAQFALNAFRCMAANTDPSDVIAAFDQRLGVTGRATLGAFHLLAREMGTAGVRRIAIAAPGSCRVTRDELGVLALLSAAQALDGTRTAAQVAWLLGGRRNETLAAAASAIGSAFKSAGLSVDSSGLENSPVRGSTLGAAAKFAGAA
jgi:hypothetical protein